MCGGTMRCAAAALAASAGISWGCLCSQPPKQEAEQEAHPTPPAPPPPPPAPQPEPEPQPEPKLQPEPEAELAAAITVMINTSPIEIHPSTVIIEEIVGALLGHVPLLRRCPKLIVCDGFKVREANRYRAGQITAEKAARYREYVERLRRLSAPGSGNVLEGAQVLVLAERQGFGYAVRAALPRVATPYILMQQHDRRLRQPFDVLGVLRAMEASQLERGDEAGRINYVGLCTTTTLGHAHKMSSKYQLDVEPHCRLVRASAHAPAGCGEQLRLVPLLQWYDSTHLCATEHYRHFVFGRRKGKRLVAKGGFIEDKCGQAQLAEVRQGGVAANRDWGSFLLDDGSGAERNWLVEHLDGHDVLTVRKCKWVSERTASEQGEIYGTVADFWKRSAHGRSGDFCEAVDAGGAEALLASCRAAQKPQAPGS